MIDMDENTASCVPPAAFAERMPARPFLTSEPLGWTDTTVQRYSMSRLAFEVPPARDVRMGFHLADPLLVGARLGSDERGIRRHVLTCSLGFVLAVLVTTANAHDTQPVRALLARAAQGGWAVERVKVDGIYVGPPTARNEL